MKFLSILIVIVAIMLPGPVMAQHSGDSWYEPGTTIAVKMHRVHVRNHHYVRIRSYSNRGHHTRVRGSSSRLAIPSVTLPSVTSPLYQEFVAWCLVQVNQCIVPPKGASP